MTCPAAMSMSGGLVLGRITQPSSQLHNRTTTLGYRLRRPAQPHTYDSRKSGEDASTEKARPNGTPKSGTVQLL